MARVVIKDVDLDFPIYGTQHLSLRHAIYQRATGGVIERSSTGDDRVVVRALNGISMELKEGDRLGLVGHNGAGKSTLLKAIAGIYEPIRGSILIEGTVTPLFDMMPGLDVEDSGYENIFTSGLLLGMSRQHIESKIPEIEEFCELGEYLNLPVRTYSAGMMTRLGFALVTALDPDVLLMDEGFGAADLRFAERSAERMDKFIGRSRIMILASHSDSMITSICNKAAWLNGGKLVEVGPVAEIFGKYHESVHRDRSSKAAVPAPDLADTEFRAVALPEWGLVADTDEAWTAHEGWSHNSILQTQLRHWPNFLRSVEGPRALGQSHVATVDAAADYSAHNTIMSFGYVMGRVAHGRESASVLDWGGRLGHYYVYARALFPAFRLDYVVKESPGFCEAGRKLLPDVVYLSDETEAFLRSYDFVFASASLQFARDPYGLLARLCDSAVEWLMITRTPIIEHHSDFVVVHRPHSYGYLTELTSWFINRRRLLDFVTARGFLLERQFLVAEPADVPNAPERAQHFGFLFRRASERDPL